MGKCLKYPVWRNIWLSALMVGESTEESTSIVVWWLALFQQVYHAYVDT